MPPVSSQGMSPSLDKATLSAFRADDSLIAVVTTFDMPKSIPLLSAPSGRWGPIRSGIASDVPLWLALILKERSLAVLALPSWMNRDTLANVLHDERTSERLVNDTTRLPFHYYEISRRLAPHVSDPSISLLIEDILQLRLDKLRHQFQQLLKSSGQADGGNNEEGTGAYAGSTPHRDLLVTVPGIACQELAVLGDFVSQALCDVRLLQRTPLPLGKDGFTVEGTTTTTTGDGSTHDGHLPPTTAAASAALALRRSRVPLRRFRDNHQPTS